MRDPFLSLSKSNKPEVIIMDEWTAKLGFTTGCDIAPKKTKQQRQNNNKLVETCKDPLKNLIWSSGKVTFTMEHLEKEFQALA